MLIIDGAATAVGIAALLASPFMRYMFAVFLVVTVSGFAFGARAGIIACPRRAIWPWIILLSAALWFFIAWAALVWWLNRYGS